MKVLLYTQNFGHGRGVAYVARAHVKALLELGYEVTVMCFGGLDKGEPEFDLPVRKLHTTDFWQVDGEMFKQVLQSEKPDYCFFYEYDQWQDNKDDLIDICKEEGVKPVGAWIAWEKLFQYMVPKFSKFEKIFVYTKEQLKVFRKFGLMNSYHIPFGLDLKEFDTEVNKHDKLVFLHTGGYGGVRDRRNTQVVIDAYELVKDENTELIVTSQKVKSLSYSEIKELYKQADCYVCPSKWEGLGLPNMESIISGTPVITTNYPPMNEFVKENKTGLLVDAIDFEITEDIGIAQQIIDPKDLAEKMKMFKQDFIREVLANGCKKERESFSHIRMAEALKKELE